MNGLSRSLLSLTLCAALCGALSACAEEEKPRPNGQLCAAAGQCVSNLCHSSTCLDPAADDDGDGLINEVEFALGTIATTPDSDGDGIPDYTEVVDPSAAADQDGDGTIDAMESAHIDTDCNGLPDQYDPGGIEPDPLKPPETLCSDDIVAKFPDLAGLCCPDADEDGVEDLMDCDPNDKLVKVDADCLKDPYTTDKCNTYTCQKGFKCVPASVCPASDEPCSTNTCDQGVCTLVPADQNCNDGDPCTVDSCINGESCFHAPKVCTDDNVCTTDTCNEGVCEFELNEDLCECASDADCPANEGPCEEPDVCEEGTCVPADEKTEGCCVGDDDCQDDETCNIASNKCESEPQCVSSTDCDDDDVCTLNDCNGQGVCEYLPNANCCKTDGDCADNEDAKVCTADNVCVQCESESDCDDDDVCTVDQCSSEGVCQNPPKSGCCKTDGDCVDNDDGKVCTADNACVDCATEADCDDGNVCTEDTCDGDGACQNETTPDKDCCISNDDCPDPKTCNTDSNVCVVANECAVNADCVGGNPCKPNLCEAGTCVEVSLAVGEECDDFDPCTHTDSCDETGVCVGDELLCDDQDPCTEGACDDGSCVYMSQVDEPCDDGNPCTVGEVCNAEAECGAIPNVECDDGNPCTTEGVCDEDEGCVYTVTEDLCGFEEVCAELQGCNEDCAEGSTVELTTELYEQKGFVTQPGGTLLCDQSECVVDKDQLPTSDGAFVFNVSVKFPQNGELRMKTFAPVDCDTKDTFTSYPVYEVYLEMTDGVATARVQWVNGINLSTCVKSPGQELIEDDEGEVLDLPGPGEWFTFSVGVGNDGKLNIALPNGDAWFNSEYISEYTSPYAGKQPYNFELKTTGAGVEISPLLLVPNVDSCCATDADCEDGDPCTEHSCNDGTCVAQIEGCDDENPCTKDVCQAQGCSSVVIDDEASLSDQKQVIDDGCQDLGCTPVIGSTIDDVSSYCDVICGTIENCEEDLNVIISGGGLNSSCLDTCQEDLSENLLSAAFWSCRAGLADEEGLCGEEASATIAETCGTASCPPEASVTCEGLCDELEGCGFSGLPEAPENLEAIWGPGPLCASSCTGFGLSGTATPVIANCVSSVFEKVACDYETAGLCGAMGPCHTACQDIFGSSESPADCHAGTPLRVQLGTYEECTAACKNVPVNKRTRFSGCLDAGGCGEMPMQCTLPQASFGNVSLLCEEQCTAAIEACGPLPYLPTVQSCKSWCEGVSVSSEGLDESIDLAGALVAAGCPTGIERLRVLFSELIDIVPVCEDACATSAAQGCYTGGANENFDEAGCQVSCSSEYFAQDTGFIEDGSCGELIEACSSGPCDCVQTCTQDFPVGLFCNAACAGQVEANLYGTFQSCAQDCSDGGTDALIRAACWATAPSVSLAAVRCEQAYGPGEISEDCVELCVPTAENPSEICSDVGGYSCAVACEGARRWATADAQTEMLECISGMLGSSCDLGSIGAQCGNLACSPSGCPESPDECKEGVCDLNVGLCAVVNEADGSSCGAGNQCLEAAVCIGGECGGISVLCESSENPCEKSECEPETGCVFVSVDEGTSCDDEDSCSVGDKCDDSGACSGEPLDCHDEHDCTSDTCEAGVGCVFTPNDAECSDGVDCTVDTCEENGCHHTLDATLCDDNILCTQELCHPAAGCGYTPQNDLCDDGDDCTSDLCSASQGCLFEQIDNCVGLPGGGGEEIGLDILCEDGTEPLSYEVVVLSNPGAESGKQDWTTEFGLFESYNDQSLVNCQAPTPPQGSNAWILGEVCDESGGTAPFYTALTEAGLTAASKAIMQSGNGQVRLTVQAGTDHSGVEIEALIRWIDATGQETSFLGTTDILGPAPEAWNIIQAVASIPTDLNSIHVGVKIGGDVSPVGGWFDDVHVEMLECP